MTNEPTANDAKADVSEANDAQNAALRAAMNDPQPGTSELRPISASSPRFFARLGLAIAHPRWALTIAADRDNSGRSGSDLTAAIAILLLGTHLRRLVAAVWLGSAVEPGLGIRAALLVIKDTIQFDLGLLVLGALIVFVLAGARRNLGRAFDLACVAALPLLLVDLGATVVVQTAGIAPVSHAVSLVLSGIACGWMGVLIVLAIRPARTMPVRVPAPPAAIVTPARRLGWGVAVVAALGVATQTARIADHPELVKPMKNGDQAPAIALPQIGPAGTLGDRFTLAATRGKVTVIDFWATWCTPCLTSMPRLENLARSHPDVAVLAINVDDDPARARAWFDERGFTMKLLADDGEVSQRYGVSTIPHTVVIDPRGAVREVVRGTSTNLAAIVEAAHTPQ